MGGFTLDNKWLTVTIDALEALGGHATLEQIYNKFKELTNFDLSSYTDWKAQIRKNIYLHSSDCEIFKGSPGDETDIFHSFQGKGNGMWGFRNRQIQPSILIPEPFKINQLYKRSELHDIYGGNRQRGISVSKKSSMLFIFSGSEGAIYGYEDGWQDAETFYYTGEGQVGDQEFKEGNKALRDHTENNKDVYLFEKVSKNGLYKFVNQLTCVGYHFSDGLDKNGNLRSMIVFEFVVSSALDSKIATANEDELVDEDDLLKLRQLATNASSESQGEVQKKKVMVRKRAAAIKKYALVRSNGNCEGCLEEAPFITPTGDPFLEVHHLKRLSDGGPDAPENVIALCPNCHRRVHYGIDSSTYNSSLIEKIKDKESLLLYK
jgi:5-methylcytosine-specific restriction enzyme A